MVTGGRFVFLFCLFCEADSVWCREVSSEIFVSILFWVVLVVSHPFGCVGFVFEGIVEAALDVGCSESIYYLCLVLVPFCPVPGKVLFSSF